MRPEDENYENDSVQQLENELKMEEYLKQKLQDEAYQVWGARPTPPVTSAPAPPWPGLSHYRSFKSVPSPSFYPPFLEYSDYIP